MPTAYKIEVSPNKRAGCKDARCKAENVKILQGELRFGTWVTIGDHQSWSFKHWGCVTPKQVENLNKFMEGNFELLEGYDELDSEWQEKIKTAVEQGHVDDEDWKWEPELNRPGARRTPKKKAKPVDEEAEDEPASPLPKSKKRGRKVNDDGDGDNDAAKAPSKKRGRKVKANAEDDNAGEQEPAPAKKKATKSKAKVKEEEAQAEVEVPAKKKATKTKAKPKTEVKAESDIEGEEEIEVPAKKKATKTKAKPKTDVKAESDIKEELKEQAPQKSRAKKAKTETSNDALAKKGRKKKESAPAEAGDGEPTKPAKGRGRPKNSATPSS